MIYLGLIAGLVILLVSGDALVRGAVAMATRLGVPALVIGLTVVAFGTSTPELVVSISAATTGAPGIAIGNIVGSNIANVLLVLGLPALIVPTDCDQPLIIRNTIYVLGASVLFIILCFLGPLTWWHGAVLSSLIVVFLIDSGRRAGDLPDEYGDETEIIETVDGVAGIPQKRWVVAGFIFAGIAGLPLGAHLMVDNGAAIARVYGISDAAIGLTIIALGTSLPELATSLSAALRGHCGVALGNVLGSNLFNILAIMGITAMVAPIPVPESILKYNLWIMLAAALAIVPFAFGRRRITRIPAAIFVFSYVVYLAFVFSPEQTALMAAAN